MRERLKLLVLAMLAVLLHGQPVAAAIAERTIADYTHQKWSDETNSPAPVWDIAQGRDGYLWLATGRGLFRFDGIVMEPLQRARDLAAHGPPSALLVRKNGELWTNFERSRRFAVYRGGRLRLLALPPAPDRIAAMRETADGTIWALTENVDIPLVRYRDGKWRGFDRSDGLPVDDPFSMLVSRSGDVWVAFSQSVYRLPAGAERFRKAIDAPGSLGRLSQDPAGRIWFSERRGSYPLTGPEGRGAPQTLRFAYPTDAAQIRGHPIFDRTGNLWIATRYGGIQRVARADPRGAASPREAASKVETFGRSDGLTSNVTARIFEDAEGNLWVGTEKGLDKFWPATMRTEPLLVDPAAFGDLLLAASDGTVYVAESSVIYRVLPHRDPEAILKPGAEPSSLCEAPDGAIWIGVDKKVLIWKGGRVRRTLPPIPTAHTIYDCAFDRHGRYWVSAARGGLYRYDDGRWETMFGGASPDFQPRSMVADRRGVLTLQWNARTLAQIDFPGVQKLPNPYRMTEPLALVLHPAADGSMMLVAGPVGLARLRDGEFARLERRQVPTFEEIHGMVQSSDGTSWFAGVRSVLRVRTTDLDRAFADPRFVPPVRAFGGSAGLRSRPHSHTRRALVQGGDGRIWISTQSGTLWLDPANIITNRNAPRLAVRAIRTGKLLFRDPVDLELPPATTDIEIDFAALSFANPRLTRVRYRLEGQEEAWVDAGTRRQAFYTNLAPGRYRFRVIAANEDGVWNRQGTTVDFEIPPTFTQSFWFVLICAIGLLLVVGLLLRLRAAQINRQFHTRLDERVRERERIARDLHDTLLQGFQGLILRFQSVADRMPVASRNRQLLEAALERADDLIVEGRDRVGALRTGQGPGDMPSIVRDLAASPLIGLAIPARVDIRGEPRPVDRVVAAEIADIVREALFNVARHAQASKLSILLGYGERELEVAVHDDGVGIAEEIVMEGQRSGHFGLLGMRERAARIGAQLAVESSAGHGTEIRVKVPARLAYFEPKQRRMRWLRDLFRTDFGDAR